MRFILRYRKPGPIPDEQCERINRLEGVRILERSLRMLLVEGDEVLLRSFVDSAPGWTLMPEVTQYEVPEARPKPSQQD